MLLILVGYVDDIQQFDGGVNRHTTSNDKRVLKAVYTDIPHQMIRES